MTLFNDASDMTNGPGAVFTIEALRRTIDDLKHMRREHYTGEFHPHIVTPSAKARIDAGGDPKNEICLACGGWPLGPGCRPKMCCCEDPESHQKEKP